MKFTIILLISLMLPAIVSAKEASTADDNAMAVFLFETLTLKPTLLYYNEDDPYAVDYDDLEFDYEAVVLNNMVKTIQENELAAEIEYDQPFILYAPIDKITRIMGTPIVSLKNKSDSLLDRTINAFFDEDSVTELATLKKGKSITIACKRWTYGMSVSLRDCQLMRDTFEEYEASINPTDLVKRLCERKPIEQNVVLAAVGSTIQALDEATKEDFYRQAVASDTFKYRGLTGDLVENAKFVPFAKDLKKALNKVKGNGTPEDC